MRCGMAMLYRNADMYPTCSSDQYLQLNKLKMLAFANCYRYIFVCVMGVHVHSMHKFNFCAGRVGCWFLSRTGSILALRADSVRSRQYSV